MGEISWLILQVYLSYLLCVAEIHFLFSNQNHLP